MYLLFRTKKTKWLPPDMICGLKITQNAFAAGALPCTPLGSSQHSPYPLVGFVGPLCGSEGRGMGRERRGREERGMRGRQNRGTERRRGEGGEGKGGERKGGWHSGRKWGIDAPLMTNKFYHNF